MSRWKGRIEKLDTEAGRNQTITLSIDGDLRETYDTLKDTDVSVEIKKYHAKRSLDANGYCWVLMDKIAAELRIPKAEVYRSLIREIGGVSEMVCVREDGAEKLVSAWGENGIGWIADTMPSKLPGCLNVILYYGSSTYDTRQMSTLIDAAVELAKSLGIDTATPEEIAKYKNEWRI